MKKQKIYKLFSIIKIQSINFIFWYVGKLLRIWLQIVCLVDNLNTINNDNQTFSQTISYLVKNNKIK